MSNEEIWQSIVACLEDDEDGPGYLFDLVSTEKDAIQKALETAK